MTRKRLRHMLSPIAMGLGMIRFRPFHYFMLVATSVATGAVAAQLIGLLTRRFFNVLTGEAAVGIGPYAIAALLIGISVGQAVVSITHTYIYAAFALVIGNLMRWNLFNGIFKKPALHALPASVGECANRLVRDIGPPLFTVQHTTYLAGSLAFAVVALITMIRTNVAITFVVFLPVAIVMGTFRLVSNRVGKLWNASRGASGAVSELLEQMFEAVPSVKAAVAEKAVIRELRRRNERRQTTELKAELFSNILWSSYSSLTSLATGVVLLLCASAMQSGTFTVGDFAIFVYYLGSATQVATEIGSLLSWYKRSQVSKDRLTPMMETPSTQGLLKPAKILHRRGVPPYHPTILTHKPLSRFEVRGLSYHFPDSPNGIDDISISLEKGEFLAVTGRIGSGKSTFLRAILGIVIPDAGELLWNGLPIDDPNTFLLPPHCAYIPQTPRLVSDTIRHNIVWDADLSEGQIANAIHDSVLEYDISQMNDGLETVVGLRGVRLSGGQVQRTATARALVRNTDLVVVDDLSSALDVETELALWEHISKRRESDRAAWIVVSHRRPTLKMVDKVIVLREGRVDAFGTLDEVLEASEEMRLIWRTDDLQQNA